MTVNKGATGKAIIPFKSIICRRFTKTKKKHCNVSECIMDTIKHATCEFSSELLPFFVFQVGIVETLTSVDRRWGIKINLCESHK